MNSLHRFLASSFFLPISSRSDKLRMVKEFSCTALFALVLLGLSTRSLVAAEVSYSDDPGDSGSYEKTAMLLRDVFGSDDPTDGSFTETYPPSFTVNGTGMQDVTFNFLYEDGGYTFEFGFFYVTDELMAMPTNTVAEKQAWAIEALTSSACAAQSIILDKESSTNLPADPDNTNIPFKAVEDTTWVNPYPSDTDAYMGERSAVNSRTISMMGGTRIEFFIIPNNTLASFQEDAADGNFSWGEAQLTGSSQYAWPLFSYADANPGTGTDGAGEGLDQVMTFDGQTVTNMYGHGTEEGTMVAFEDIRRIGTASDEDFSDLVFFIGNVASDTPVPEPGTVFAGIFLALALATSVYLRKRKIVLQ